MIELSKLRQSATYNLIFFANVQKGSPNIKEAQESYRSVAATLLGFIHRRHCLVFWMPSRPGLQDAADALIALSNSLDSVDFGMKKKFRHKIISILALKIRD
jgi:hypothetical protein